jgi:hypothetical protein
MTTPNHFPKKDQAIILTANENLKNRDYGVKIANLIGGAQHILYLENFPQQNMHIFE